MIIPHRIREARVSDLGSVYTDWLKAHRGSFAARGAWNSLYFSDEGQRGVIHGCVQRGRVLVACSPDDDDQILGWACDEATSDGRRVLHYVYVKHMWRNNGKVGGLCKALMTAMDLGNPLIVSHTCVTVQRWQLAGTETLYVPYLAPPTKAKQ